MGILNEPKRDHIAVRRPLDADAKASKQKQIHTDAPLPPHTCLRSCWMNTKKQLAENVHIGGNCLPGGDTNIPQSCGDQSLREKVNNAVPLSFKSVFLPLLR